MNIKKHQKPFATTDIRGSKGKVYIAACGFTEHRSEQGSISLGGAVGKKISPVTVKLKATPANSKRVR